VVLDEVHRLERPSEILKMRPITTRTLDCSDGFFDAGASSKFRDSAGWTQG